MENIHKRFIDDLIEAEKLWQSADHLVYVTLPVVRDNKLMVRALENLHKALVLIITTILKFEYLYKRINLTSDTRKNLELFFSKCSFRYNLGREDIEIIKQILYLGKKHKESGFEFSKSGKIIILDDSLRQEELTADKIKKFLDAEKKLLENTNRIFRGSV